MSTAPDATADGIGVPATGAHAGRAGDATAAPASAPPLVRGPWFDPRAFFLGWLAMVVAFLASASGALVALVGFATAFLLARRSRVVNALVTVAGGTVASVVLLLALFLILNVTVR